MKPFFDLLHEKLLDYRPRATAGDQDLIDVPEEEHVAEVVGSLYQIPKWEVLDNMRELYRRARHSPAATDMARDRPASS